MFFTSTQKRLLEFFDASIKNYDPSDPQVVGWSTTHSQRIRFDLLSELADFSTSSVLDVGCGVGDFWGYLNTDSTFKGKYHGIDIHPKMIELAKAKYPDGQFMLGDLEDWKKNVDYVVASGPYNLAVRDNYAYIESMVKLMLKSANLGISFNLLSSYAPASMRYSGLFYYDPAKVLTLCKRMVEKVVLLHDYLPNDFSVLLYK